MASLALQSEQVRVGDQWGRVETIIHLDVPGKAALVGLDVDRRSHKDVWEWILNQDCLV